MAQSWTRLGIVIAALGLASFAWTLARYRYGGAILWDLEVYVQAARLQRAGGNAYTDLDGLRFVYPPIVLWGMAALGPALKPVLLAMYALALALTSQRSLRAIVIGFALFSGLTWLSVNRAGLSVLTGNITLFLHLALVWAWMSAPPARPRFVFWALVIVAAIAKPYFLAYLALPLLTRPRANAHFAPVAVTAAIVLGVWGAQAWLAPEAFGDFITSLRGQVFKGSDIAHKGDVGHGAFYYFAMVTGNRSLALILHTALFALFGWMIWRMRVRGAPADTIVFATLCFVIACNPRLKIYDDAILSAIGTAWVISLMPRVPAPARWRGPLMILGVYWSLMLAGRATGIGTLTDIARIFESYGPALVAIILMRHIGTDTTKNEPGENGTASPA